MNEFDQAKVDHITVSWHIDGVPVYFLLLGRDGTINRMGDGRPGTEKNMYIGFDPEIPAFTRLCGQLANSGTEFGLHEASDLKGPVSDLEILLYFGPRDATGYKILAKAGSESPREVMDLVSSSMTMTHQWWTGQKKLAHNG